MARAKSSRSSQGALLNLEERWISALAEGRVSTLAAILKEGGSAISVEARVRIWLGALYEYEAQGPGARPLVDHVLIAIAKLFKERGASESGALIAVRSELGAALDEANQVIEFRALEEKTDRRAAAERLLGDLAVDHFVAAKIDAWTALGEAVPARADEALASVRALQTRLALPEDIEVGQAALRSLLRVTGDAAALLPLLESDAQTKASRPGIERLPLYLELAGLELAARADEQRSIDWFQQALRAAPAQRSEVYNHIEALTERHRCSSRPWHELRLGLAKEFNNHSAALESLDILAPLLDEPAASSLRWEALERAEMVEPAILVKELIDRHVNTWQRAEPLREQIIQRMWARAADGSAAPLWRDAVERLLLEGEDLSKYHALLKSRVESAPSTEARRDSRLRLARFEIEQLHNNEAAAATLRPLLLAKGWAEDEEIVEIAAQIADILEASIVNSLRAHLRSADRWDELAALLTRLGADISIDGHLDLAEAYLLHLDRASAGGRLLVTAQAKITTASQAERGLALAQRTGDEGLVIAYLELLESLAKKPAQKLEWAERRLRAQLDLNDQIPLALDELVERGAMSGAAPWAALLDELLLRDSADQHLAELAADLGGEQGRALLLRTAQAKTLSTDAGRAFALIAAEYGPLDIATLRQLRASLEATGELEALTSLLTTQADHHPPAEALIPLAALQLDGPDQAAALDRLGEAFASDPADPALRDAALSAWESAQRWDDLAGGLHLVLAQDGLEDSARVSTTLRLHSLLQGPLERPDKATALLPALLSLKPDLHALRDEAAERALDDGDFELRIRVLSAGRDLKASEHTELAFEVGALGHRIGKWSTVLEAWEAFLLSADEGDPRARGVLEEVLLHLSEQRDSDENDDLAIRVSSTFPRVKLTTSLEDLSQELLDDDAAEPAGRIIRWWGQIQPDSSKQRRGELRLLRLIGRHDESFSKLMAWHASEPDTLPAVERLNLASELLRRDGGDRQLAITLLRQLLTEEPAEYDTLEVVDELTTGEEKLELARALQAWGTQHADQEAALARWARAAELARGEDIELAQACWRAILDKDPKNEDAFQALEQSLLQAGEHDRLKELLEAGLEHADDDGEKTELLRRMAHAATTPEEAQERWEAVLESNPGDVEALRSVATFHEAAERWEPLLTTWERLARARSLGIAARVDILRDATKLALEKLEDRSIAARTLQAILALLPDDHETMAQLELILRETESWESLAAHLDHCSRYAESEDKRIALLREEAELLAYKVGRPADGCSVLLRVLQMEPRNLPVLEDLASMQADAGLWNEHLATLEKLEAASVIRELKAEILVRAADVLHTHLDRSADALGLMLNAVEIIQLNDDQLELGRAMVAASGEWRQWGLLLRRAADLSPDNRQREKLEAELGRVIDLQLGEPVTAMQILAESFEEHMRLGPALFAMEEVATRQNRRDQLLPFYAKLREARPHDKEAVWHAMSRSAEIAVEDLNLPDRAFRILIEARRFAPEGTDIEQRMRDVVEKHELWDEYVDHLNDEWERIEEPGKEVELLVAKARAEREHLKDWKTAIESLIAALTIDPLHEGAREVLYKIAHDRGLWPVVIQLQLKLIEDSPEDKMADLFVALADMHAREREAWSEAADAVEEAMLVSPDPAALFGKAREYSAALEPDRILSTWARLTHQTDDREIKLQSIDAWMQDALALESWDSLRDALSSKFKLEPPSASDAQGWQDTFSRADKTSHFLEIASIAAESIEDAAGRHEWLTRYAAAAEASESWDHAAKALSQLRLADPDDAALQEQYEQALELAGDWETYEQILRDRFSAEGDEEVATELALRLALALAEHSNDQESATAFLTDALSKFPTSGPIREVLEARLEATESWENLADILISSARSIGADDLDTSTVCLRRAVELAEDFLSDSTRLQEAASLWLELNPEDAEALEVAVRAAGTLEDPDTLVEAQRALAEVLEGSARVEALITAAMTSLERGENIEQARELLSSALVDDEEPAADLSLAFSQVEAAAGDHEAAVQHAERAIDSLRQAYSSGRELSEGLQYLGELLAIDEATKDKARAALEEACTSNPANIAARQALERLLQGSGDHEAMLKVFTDERDHAPTEELRLAAINKRVRLLAFELERAEEALPEAQLIAQRDTATSIDTLLLGDVAYLAGSWDEAAAAYQSLAALEDGAGLKVDVQVLAGEAESDRPLLRFTTRLGRIYEEAGALDEAFDFYTEANLEDDSYVPAILGMARISLARRNGAAARLQTEEVLETLPEDAPVLRGEVFVILGRAAELERNFEQAANLFLDAFRADPDSDLATLHIIEAAPRMADPTRACEILDKVRDKSPYVDLQAAASFAKGHLLLARPQLHDEAAAAFESVLALPLNDEDLLRESVEALTSLLDSDTALLKINDTLERVSSDSAKAALLLQRGRIVADSGDAIEAAADLREASRLQPFSAAPLDLLVSTLSAKEHAPMLVEHLEFLLESCPADAISARAQLQLPLGRLLLELDRPQDAISHLEPLSLATPSDARVHALLLKAYSHEAVSDAVGSMNTVANLVSLGQLSEHMLVDLERVHQASDDLDGLIHILEVRHLAGIASPDEVELLASITPTLPVFPARALEGRLFDQAISSTFGERQVTELMQSAAERIQPTSELPGDAQPITEDSAAGHVWRGMQRAFGAELPLYRSDSQIEPTRLIQTDQLCGLLSPELADESDEAVLRFELSQLLTAAKREYRLTSLLDSFNFLTLFEAAIQPASIDTPNFDESIANAIAGWKAQLEGFEDGIRLQQLPRERLPNDTKWRDQATSASAQVALLTTMNPGLVFERLLAETGSQKPTTLQELESLIDKYPALRGLLSFLLSARFLKAKRELGVSLSGAEEPAAGDDGAEDSPAAPVEEAADAGGADEQREPAPGEEADAASDVAALAADGDTPIAGETPVGGDASSSDDNPEHD